MKFVFQYNVQGERTPMFTNDQRFNITKNIYKQGPNKLTLVGLKNSFSQGEDFKDLYVNHHRNFLSNEYIPSEYFIRSFPDNPSMMSAYGFMLGANPGQVEGIGVIQEKGDSEQIEDVHVDDARKGLHLDRPMRDAQPAYIHVGNSDGFFFKDIQSMYPGLEKDFNKNMEEAAEEFQNKEGTKLFYKLAALMDVPRSDLNFQNIAQYLDDYISAFANNKNTDPFEFDQDSLEMITEYYIHLIKRGLLRDPDLNKVLAHPFLSTMLREILFKAQDANQLKEWEGPCVTNKVSLAFGNRLTYLAVLRVLEIDDGEPYNPGWGDQLTFQLFKQDGEWFVKIFNDDVLITLGDTGENIPLSTFREYVCSRLYYGDMDAVEAGEEDYHEMANIIGGECGALVLEKPLFGCKKRTTQQQLRNNQRIGSSSGNMDDAVYYVRSRARQGYSYSYSSDTQPSSSYSYTTSPSSQTQSSGSSSSSQPAGSEYTYSSSSYPSSSYTQVPSTR